MGLLDLFRPKWKHSRAEVRLEAVRQLGEDDLAALREIAQRDPEAKVRELAMKRIPDAVILDELARDERETSLRELAGRRASELSVRTAVDSEDTKDALAAVARISDPKLLVDVVRKAKTADAKKAALARIDDQRALGDVVQKTEGALRDQALARIIEPKVFRDLALSEQTTKAIQLRAVSALSDGAMLKAVAERAKTKGTRTAAKDRMTALGISETAPDQTEKKAKKKKQIDPAAEQRLKQRKIEADMRRRAEEERKRSVGDRKSLLEAEHLSRVESEEAASRAAEAQQRRDAEAERIRAEERAQIRAEQDALDPEAAKKRAARDAEKAERDAVKQARDAERAAIAKENAAQMESLVERLEALGKRLEGGASHDSTHVDSAGGAQRPLSEARLRLVGADRLDVRSI